MIEVERLTKRYGDRTAVRGVDIHVERGEIVGFLGPNGAGKSTTLRMITGYLAPTSGRVSVGGIDVGERPREARRLIGYMPEGVPLYPELRVAEYLRHRAVLKGVARRDLAGRVDAALEQAGVAHVRHQLVGTLSKGYRQRVGLADALVADPPVLVLDEPTAGLDPNQIRDVRELVRGFAGKKTVILSTHILPEVEATCSRVVIVHRGRVVGEGAPAGLRARAAGGREVVLEGPGDAAAFRAAVADVPGVRAVSADAQGPEGVARLRIDGDAPDLPERVFRAVADAGLTLRELRTGGGSLEEVFARLTTQVAADAPAEPPGAEDAADDTPAEEAAP